MGRRRETGNGRSSLQARHTDSPKCSASLVSAPPPDSASTHPALRSPRNIIASTEAKHPIRVAIIHPVQRTRAHLKAVLEASGGFQVIGAYANATGALKEVPRLNLDVALLNPDLPDLSGTECIARLKSLLPGLRIVIHSPSSDPANMLLHIYAGARGFVCNDAPPEELCRVLGSGRSDGIHLCQKAQKSLGAAAIQASGSEPLVTNLAPRHKQILALMAEGWTDTGIAAHLGLGEDGVAWHVRGLFKRYGVHSRAALLAKLARLRQI
jgi:DNA-binding NarL/FixJ family response regulator